MILLFERCCVVFLWWFRVSDQGIDVWICFQINFIQATRGSLFYSWLKFDCIIYFLQRQSLTHRIHHIRLLESSELRLRIQILLNINGFRLKWNRRRSRHQLLHSGPFCTGTSADLIIIGHSKVADIFLRLPLRCWYYVNFTDCAWSIFATISLRQWLISKSPFQILINH